MSKISRRRKADYYLIAAMAIWGMAGPIVKFTLDGIDPLPFLSYRFFLASILSVFLIKYFKLKIPKGKLLLLTITYGVLATTIALSILFFGLKNSSALDLTLIGTTGPLIIAVGGWLIFRDKITRRELKGISLALLGTLIVTIGPLLQNGVGLRLTGNILLFIFLLIDSSSILLSKYILKKNVDPFALANIAFIAGALTLIPISIYFYGFDEIINSVSNLEFKYHLGVWYMAFLSGNMAYAFLMRGEKTIEISEAGLFGYLQPLFAIPLAVFWLGESFTIYFIVGAIFVTSGVYIAETRDEKKIML